MVVIDYCIYLLLHSLLQNRDQHWDQHMTNVLVSLGWSRSLSQESIPTVSILSLVYIMICIQTLKSVTEPLFGFGLVPPLHSLFLLLIPFFLHLASVWNNSCVFVASLTVLLSSIFGTFFHSVLFFSLILYIQHFSDFVVSILVFTVNHPPTCHILRRK